MPTNGTTSSAPINPNSITVLSLSIGITWQLSLIESYHRLQSSRERIRQKHPASDRRRLVSDRLACPNHANNAHPHETLRFFGCWRRDANKNRQWKTRQSQ